MGQCSVLVKLNKGDKTLAKLSKRVYDPDEVRVTFGDKEIKGFSEIETQSKSTHTHHIDGDKSNNSVDNLQFVGTVGTNKSTNGENNNMATRNIRTVNATLNNHNTNLALKDTLVFQKTLIRTEHSDDKTIQNLLMSGAVQKAIEAHNTKLEETVDKSILKNTGVKVFLEPVEIWDLDWTIVTVA